MVAVGNPARVQREIDEHDARRRPRPVAAAAGAYTSAMAVDERRIAILGAGKIGESLIAGLL